MSNKKTIKLHNQLFFKMYVSYACVLAFSALLIGIIFMKVFERVTINNFQHEMQVTALSIARNLQQYILDEDYSSAVDYVTKIEQLDTSKEFWIISNANAENPMDSSMENINFENTRLQKEFTQIINAAYRGEEKKDIFSSRIHQDDQYVVGVPIRGMNDEVVGALIYCSPADSQKAIIKQSIDIIIKTIISAFFISIVLANLFVRTITKPILKMRDTAHELAEGHYEVRTEIKQKSEIGQLANTVDILAERLLENEKMQKNLDQMRLDFFANVSHELRTPITVIRAYTETLYDRVVTDEEKQMQYYERMLHECKSMERLVGDLLVLSKMQNPDFEIDKEPVNVVQIFEDISRGVNAIGEEKNVMVLVDYNDKNSLIYGDYDRLRQMFMVILDNAIKFSKKDSTIRIKIEKSDILTISIKDDGVGISPEELPYIFEKFYRSKLRQNATGSGLGLAIAKQIALKHDGQIAVNSELGKGTEFVFTFHLLSETVYDMMNET